MTKARDPIKRFELKDGSVRYRFVVDMGRKPDGRRDQRTHTFTTLKQARAERARIISDRARGTLVKPDKSTVREACDAWLDGRRGLKPGTRRTYADALSLICGQVGHVKLSALTKGQIDQAVTYLLASGRRVGNAQRTGLSPRSVNVALTLLSAVCELARKEGRVGRNVVELVDRPTDRPAGGTTWTQDQASAFLASVADDRLNAAWQLSLYGLRRGEVLGLRWSDVDLVAGTLTVCWSRTLTAGRIVESTPKTEKSARTLPLDSDLLAALTGLQLRQREEREQADAAYADGCALVCPETGVACAGDHVVVDELGRAYVPDWYGRRFAALVKAAGVPSIRLHDARHSCGSIMHARGVPMADISAWLGHSRTSFTMDRYVHSQAGALNGAMTALRSAYTPEQAQQKAA